MRGYILSKDALRDLAEISEYIAADSFHAAMIVLDEIHAALAMLAERPRLGRKRPDLTSEEVRFWIVRSYLVVYAPDEAPLRILRVLSGFRDIPGLMGSTGSPWAVGEYPPASDFSTGDMVSEDLPSELASDLVVVAEA